MFDTMLSMLYINHNINFSPATLINHNLSNTLVLRGSLFYESNEFMSYESVSQFKNKSCLYYTQQPKFQNLHN